MPNWKKVVTSGSNAELNSLKLSGAVNAGTDTDKFLVLDSTGNIDFRTGAEVLSDIGGQGTGNFVTDGGGQTTELAVWSSTSAISGSQGLTWATTPTPRLDAHGNAFFYGNSGSSSPSSVSIQATGTGVLGSAALLELRNNTIQESAYIRYGANNTKALELFNAYGQGISGTGFSSRLIITGSIIAGSETTAQYQFSGSRARIELGNTVPLHATGSIVNFSGTDTFINGWGSVSASLASISTTSTNQTLQLQSSVDSLNLATGSFVASHGGIGTQLAIWDTNSSISGSNGLLWVGTELQVNGTIVADSITGSLQGNATSATNADNATKVNITEKNDNVNYQVVFVTPNGTGNQGLFIDTDDSHLIYNPATRTLTSAALVGNLTGDVTGNASTATALTAGNKTITGNLTVTGKVTAEEFHTEFVSSSIIYQSGSTKFGDTADDTHQFTGSLKVQGPITGSDLKINGFTSVSASLASLQASAPTLQNVLTNGNSTSVGIESTSYIIANQQNLWGTNTNYLHRTFTSGSTIADATNNQTIYTFLSTVDESAHIEYVVFDSPRNNKRAGSIMVTWGGGLIESTETSTKDIGDTTQFSINFVDNGGNVDMQITNNTGQTMDFRYYAKCLYLT